MESRQCRVTETNVTKQTQIHKHTCVYLDKNAHIKFNKATLKAWAKT